MKISNIMIDDMQAVRMYVDDKVVWEKEEGLLPRGYTECEYLESTGTQYIDTMINIDGELNIQVDFEIVSRNNEDNQCIFGATQDGKGKYYCLLFHDINPIMGYFQYCSNENIFNINIDAKKKLSLCTYDGKLLYNKEIISEVGKNEFISNTTIPVFAQKGGGTIRRFAIMKLYSFIVEKNGMFLMNLIPCLDQTGSPCMYDTVSKQAFYNKGTGEFLYKIKEV